MSGFRKRPGWRKISPAGLPTCFGAFKHENGCQVEHCGHPTAIWPYLLVTPDGRMLVAQNGRGFRNLTLAMEAAEAIPATNGDGLRLIGRAS